MLHIEELFLAPDATVLAAMKKLDETGQRILFVAPEGKLRAVLTDGDVRKYILRGGSLEAPVGAAANPRPISLSIEERAAARQPDVAPGSNADSMGCTGSSEVISTCTRSSSSNQSPPEGGVPPCVEGMIRLRMGAPPGLTAG